VSESGDEVSLTLALGEFEHAGDRYLSAIVSERPDDIDADRLRDELETARETIASLPDEDSGAVAAALQRVRHLLDE